LPKAGRCSAEDLARKSGFDISAPDFWLNGIGVIENRIKDLDAPLAG
jgi:oligoendopeptidase F